MYFTMKKYFFDMQRVTDAVDAATRRALSKAGSFIRRDARQSMRKAKIKSKPGNPPHVHKGQVKRFLFFAYEPDTASVIIGPEKISGVTSKTALHALEYGGETTMVIGKRHRRRYWWQKAPHNEYRQIIIQARPFMGPALKKNQPLIASGWRNEVSGVVQPYMGPGSEQQEAA